MIFFNPSIYAGLSIAIVLYLDIYICYFIPVLGIFLIILTVFSWIMLSSEKLSFFKGLRIIASTMMSGCGNITILYMPLLLVLIHLMAFYYSLSGLFKGRQYSQTSFQKIVLWFFMKTKKETDYKDYNGATKCKKCGFEYRNNSKYCGNCGDSLLS